MPCPASVSWTPICSANQSGVIQIVNNGITATHAENFPNLPLQYRFCTSTPTGWTSYTVNGQTRSLSNPTWSPVRGIWAGSVPTGGAFYVRQNGNWAELWCTTLSYYLTYTYGYMSISSVIFTGGTNPNPTYILEIANKSGAILKEYQQATAFAAPKIVCACNPGDCVKGNILTSFCCISCAQVKTGLGQILAALKGV